MANPNPSKKGQFKPGQSGNPQGGKLHNPELRAIKRLTSAEVAEIGSLIVKKNIAGLQAVAKDPESSALKVWMAAIAIKGIKSGDASKLDVLLNRITGKVKERIELSGEDGGPIRSVVGNMTKEERLAEIRRLRKLRKEAGED